MEWKKKSEYKSYIENILLFINAIRQLKMYKYIMNLAKTVSPDTWTSTSIRHPL